MYISKFDGKTYKNKLALSLHVKKYNTNLLEYLVKYEGLKIPKCPFCGNDVSQKGNRSYFNKTCNSIECKTKLNKQRTHTEETKELIRKARFNYLKNNYDKTSWYKSANNLMTYGEELLHNKLVQLNFYSTYDIVYQYPVYPYFIDFAFINEKIALEFDGSCHFINEKRIEHDIKRDKILNELGWKVFRITYKELDKFNFDVFKKFINTNNAKISKKLENRLIEYKEINTRNLNKSALNKSALNKEAYTESQLILADKLINSNIDFTVYGWVKYAAEIINKKPQKVSAWMKKFLPDFYKEKCFKRNNS